VRGQVDFVRREVAVVRGNGGFLPVFVQRGGKSEKKGGIGPNFDRRDTIDEHFYLFIGLHFFPFRIAFMLVATSTRRKV
jgi:hypothetical protein